ncbi:MAG: gluconate 2-dehydrogenase subunit 3 family protein [Balneolaceae bacterium]|nr:MAG: gluconate 2-dehydrogenase subunit 3 family protein [Balneolaceae bacterium]
MRLKTGSLSNGITRRCFLKVSAIWAGGAWIVGVPALSANPYRVLTDQEAEIMDALADCIIPPGDFYGGKDALVTRFIDRQIGPYGHLQKEKEMYQTCLSALNRGSKAEFGRNFVDLFEEQKIVYLTDIEGGKYNHQSNERGWGRFSPSAFFNTVRNHCMMGFYGSPDHGGNKDYVSYRMLGLF